MIRSQFFSDARLGFETVGPPITMDQIKLAIPESFAGKDIFINFYIQHNGGLLTDSTFFYRDIFHNSGSSEYNELYVHDFYNIPLGGDDAVPASMVSLREAIRAGCSHMTYLGSGGGAYIDFVARHIPIAGDASGDHIWIEVPSGRIRYVNFDCNPDYGPMEVAPSFIDFVANLVSGERAATGG